MTVLSKTVRLNVGGHTYEVSCSTLELHPDTMLAKLINERWKSESNDDVLFIDRNGVRFQYVLDWIRDGEVHLPVTESYEAVRKELEYYGFDGVVDSSIIPGTLEGGRIVSTVAGNVYEDLEKIDVTIQGWKRKIEEYKHRKSAIRAAHCLFARSATAQEGDRVTVRLKEEQDKSNAYEAEKVSDFFAECLAGYGLKLIDMSWKSGMSPYGAEQVFDFVLERIPKRDDESDKENRIGSASN